MVSDVLGVSSYKKRADELVYAGLGISNAAHVAFAEVNTDYFSVVMIDLSNLQKEKK
jgi:hypothetical protein